MSSKKSGTRNSRQTGSRQTGRVNLDDIARRVGVAPITVSRALRTPEMVSPGTRAKIQAAVDEFGYVPDLVAASLATRRSKVIAIILPTITQALFADTVQGLVDRLRPEGYQLIVGDSGYSGAVEASLLATLLGRRPDGVILVGGEHLAPTRRLLGNAGVPVVEIWELPDEPIDCVVGFSNRDAMYAMTQYMLDSGRRRVAFVSSRRNPRSMERLRGYTDCLADNDAGEPLAVMAVAPGSRIDPVRKFVETVAAHPDVDAVCCTDDLIAMQLLFACQRRGWAVPGRFAISGLCDLEMARHVYPALTTVRVPGYAIGQQAARLILERLDEPSQPPVVLDLGFEIVRRETA